MLQSYFNSTIYKPTLPKKPKKEFLAKEKTRWISDTTETVWISSEEEITPSRSMLGVSREVIKAIRQDFITHSNDFRKYPRMTEKDWE